MEIDPKYFPLIAGVIGVIGIAFGTLLSEIRTWLENRRSNKRILKSALYHQFELFGEMIVFDREITGSFVESLKTMLLGLGSPKEPTNEVFGELPNSLFKMLETVKTDGFKEVVEKHEAIMIKLSEVDPLFASNWSYRSRSRFPEQIKIFINEASSFSTEKNEITDKFVEHIQEWYEEKSQKRLLDSIEKGIVEIAWRIGFITWWKIRRQIKEWRQKTQEDILKEAQEYVMEIIKFVMKNQELLQKQIQDSVKEDKEKNSLEKRNIEEKRESN